MKTAKWNKLFWAINSTNETRRTSVGDAIGCVRRRRQCLLEHSSRNTMGRPVPKLILYQGNQIVDDSLPLGKTLTDDRTSRDTARSVQIQLRHFLADPTWSMRFDVPRSRSSSSGRCFPDSSASFSNARCKPRSSAMRIAWPLGSQPFVLHAARSNIPARATLSTKFHRCKAAYPSLLPSLPQGRRARIWQCPGPPLSTCKMWG